MMTSNSKQFTKLWFQVGRRSRASSPRSKWTSRCRRLHHAHPDHRQHQRTLHHDRREGRTHDQTRPLRT